jgi:hypothetical protein
VWSKSHHVNIHSGALPLGLWHGKRFKYEAQDVHLSDTENMTLAYLRATIGYLPVFYGPTGNVLSRLNHPKILCSDPEPTMRINYGSTNFLLTQCNLTYRLEQSCYLVNEHRQPSLKYVITSYSSSACFVIARRQCCIKYFFPHENPS